MPTIELLRAQGRGGQISIQADYNANNRRISRLFGTATGGPWNVLIMLTSGGDFWRGENIVGPSEASKNVGGPQWSLGVGEEGELLSPVSAAIY